MKLFAVILSSLLLASLAACDKSPLECLPLAERLQGFTFCHFGNQSSADRDVTKVKVGRSMIQGRIVKSNVVTAVLISFSDFEHIPGSAFQNFGDVTRLKIVDSKIKNIERDDFLAATHLRVLEIERSELGTVSSKAFGLLTNLEEIVIKECTIDTFPSDAFDGLELKLKTIRLENNTFAHSAPNITNKIEPES